MTEWNDLSSSLPSDFPREKTESHQNFWTLSQIARKEKLYLLIAMSLLSLTFVVKPWEHTVIHSIPKQSSKDLFSIFTWFNWNRSAEVMSPRLHSWSFHNLHRRGSRGSPLICVCASQRGVFEVLQCRINVHEQRLHSISFPYLVSPLQIQPLLLYLMHRCCGTAPLLCDFTEIYKSFRPKSIERDELPLK
jgi:hypothetical protein